MRLLVLGAMFVLGCSPSAPPPSSAPTAAPKADWELRLENLTQKVKPGMDEAAVTAAVGEPIRAKTSWGTVTTVTWEYDLGESRRAVVRFDTSNRVAAVEYASAMKVQ